MAVAGARLFVGGYAGKTNGDVDWFVRAYDRNTGAVLWQDLFDGGDFDHTVSLAARGDLVVASGLTTDVHIMRHFTVRAYDARSGALLWQDQVPTGMTGYFFATDVAWQVAVQGHWVVAAGSISDTSGIHLAVRAYDARSGALLWHDLVDKGAGADVAFAVALDGGRAFVTGSGGAACSAYTASNCNWITRAYDLDTGGLAWERETDKAGGDDQPNIIVAQGNRVLVSGGAANAAGGQDWLVQVYTASSGDLVWEDLVTSPGGVAWASDLAVSGDRVFVPGYVMNSSGISNWLVRAYALR
jgi:hypothetical protein